MDKQDKINRLQAYVGLRELHKHWGWFLALGLALVVLGSIAIGASVFTTMVSVLFIGGLLIAGGIVQGVNTFKVYKGHAFLVNFLITLLYVVSGILLVMHPVQGAIALTLLLAAFYTVSGVFKIVAAVANRYIHWGWLLFSGIVSLILGLLIWSQWPAAGLWVIGLFVGIDLIIAGWVWIALSLSARKVN